MTKWIKCPKDDCLNYMKEGENMCDTCKKEMGIIPDGNYDGGKELVVGKRYKFEQSAEILGHGKFARGMNYSTKTNTLALYSFGSGLYGDESKDSALIYTGEGKEGDQKLTGNNLTLANSIRNKVKVILFVDGYYKGEVCLSGEPYIEVEPDINKRPRNVYKFHLKIKE